MTPILSLLPPVSLCLITARLPEAEVLLAEQKVDIGVGELSGKRSAGVHAVELVRLEPVLLVPKKSRKACAGGLS